MASASIWAARPRLLRRRRRPFLPPFPEFPAFPVFPPTSLTEEALLSTSLTLVILATSLNRLRPRLLTELLSAAPAVTLEQVEVPSSSSSSTSTTVRRESFFERCREGAGPTRSSRMSPSSQSVKLLRRLFRLARPAAKVAAVGVVACPERCWLSMARFDA